MVKSLKGCDWNNDGPAVAAVIKHGTIAQCCFNKGPALKTVGQHWNNIG